MPHENQVVKLALLLTDASGEIKHGDAVASGTERHKQMPHKMTVTHARIRRKKRDAPYLGRYLVA